MNAQGVGMNAGKDKISSGNKEFFFLLECKKFVLNLVS